MEEMVDEKYDDESSHLSPSNQNVLLDGHIEFEDVKSHKDQEHHDFIDISMNPILEEPCLDVDTSLKEYFGNRAPKHIIEKLESSVHIKFEVSVEDPFLVISPQEKFPSIVKRTICKKGSRMQREVQVFVYVTVILS